MLPHMAVNFLTNRVVFRRIGEGFQQLREDGNITQVPPATPHSGHGSVPLLLEQGWNLSTNSSHGSP